MSSTPYRDATDDDIEPMLEIYAPVVHDTAVSFELEAPSLDEFAGRVRSAQEHHAWLVADADNGLAGYAYAGVHRARPAYRWSVETSVYVRADLHGRGYGSGLYRVLLDRMAQAGYCNAYAGTTLPNDGSIALHRALGFEPIGVFPRVGFKFGRWHDVSWWHRRLRNGLPAETEADACDGQ